MEFDYCLKGSFLTTSQENLPLPPRMKSQKTNTSGVPARDAAKRSKRNTEMDGLIFFFLGSLHVATRAVVTSGH